MSLRQAVGRRQLADSLNRHELRTCLGERRAKCADPILHCLKKTAQTGGRKKFRPAQRSAAAQSLSNQRGQVDARALELLI